MKKKRPLLKDIRDSAEYQFAKHGIQNADPINNISYYDAYDELGMQRFRKAWTHREFFARKNHTSRAVFEADQKLFYKLFDTENIEIEAFWRGYEIQRFLLSNLQSGTIEAFAHNHLTGNRTELKKEFWGSTTLDANYTKDFGRYPSKESKNASDRPGKDFLVILNYRQFKKIKKNLPRGPRSEVPQISSQEMNIAIEKIKNECEKQEAKIKRPIFIKFLNLRFETRYFNDLNVRPIYDLIPQEIKASRGSGRSGTKYVKI